MEDSEVREEVKMFEENDTRSMINVLNSKKFVTQKTKPFPDWRLIDQTLSRIPGSPICEGDYQIATLIMLEYGWDKMAEYWNNRIEDILIRIEKKLEGAINDS